MWNSSISGQGAGGMRYEGGWGGQYQKGVNQSDGTKDDKGAVKDSITKLIKELEDAEKTSKNQTAQELRDKLNEKRKELGEEKFKEILEEVKKDAPEGFQAFMKRAFPEEFPDGPDAPPSPAPSPSPSPDGGGGGGGRRRRRWRRRRWFRPQRVHERQADYRRREAFRLQAR